MLKKYFTKLNIGLTGGALVIVAVVLVVLNFGYTNGVSTPTAEAKSNFAASEEPNFIIDLGVKIVDQQPAEDEVKIINSTVTTASGEFTNLQPIVESKDGKISVSVLKGSNFRPGKYEVKVTYEKNGEILTFNQSFTWGVLALNTDKSVYLPGEKASIGMAVLDDHGKMVCDASVVLEITDPNGSKRTLSTSNGQIKISPECEVYGVTDLPDYYTDYTVGQIGTYILKLTAETDNGTRSITDEILVAESVDFDVQRTGPTRIYPLNKDTMKFTILANQNYIGPIVETVPASFKITPQSGLTVTAKGDIKEIMWNKNLVKGQTYQLAYEFDAPDISPEFYILGPLKIGKWQENRQWQIASDIESYWLRTNAGDSCGVGDDELMSLTQNSSDTSKFLNPTGHSWTFVESARTIEAGLWGPKLFLVHDNSGGPASTRDVRALVRRMTSGCVEIEIMVDITLQLAKGFDGSYYFTVISVPEITFDDGDIVLLEVFSPNATDEITVSYNGSADPFTSYLRRPNEAITNTTPIIESYEDFPDPIYNQNDITFSVDWYDADAENNRLFVCDADSAGIGGCSGGVTWCSTSLAATDPVSCSFTTRSEQIGSNNYYAFVCDDEDCVVTSGFGTFTVNGTSTVSLILKGGFTIKGGITIK